MAVILIVDDSPTELHLFQNMLEKSGFDVLVADSGEEGIRQAKMLSPDCILMDVVMPGMKKHSGHHDHDQGSGIRQGLGHAPGRGGIHRKTGHWQGTDGQDQRGNGCLNEQQCRTCRPRRASV